MSSSESEENVETTQSKAQSSDESEKSVPANNSEKAASPGSDSDSDKVGSGDDSDKSGKEPPPQEAPMDVDTKSPIAKSDDGKSDSEKEGAGNETVQNLVLSDSDNDAPPEPEVIVDEIPSNRLKLGDLGPVFVRFPNFLSIEQKPFDERTYDAELDDDETVDAEGRTRMKLKVENTIRWRNVKDEKTGEMKKQSNAKIVKWSDGTMSLYLGNEKFEIDDKTAMSNLHLFTRQGASLQAQAAFKRKFAFRPVSTDSLTHRKMTINMADKSNRTQKVKMIAEVGMNPEKARVESIKREEEKLRAISRKQATQRRAREKTREAGLSSGFLEGYDSEEGENVGAVKRSYGDSRKAGGKSYGAGYYSDESGSEDERSRKTLRDAKRIESDEEEEVDDSQDSRSNTGASQSNRSQRKPVATTSNRRIIEDDEEEEG